MGSSDTPERHRRTPSAGTYRTPGYPVVPLVFMGVMAMFLVSAVIYNPQDTLIGLALTATGVPVYFWLTRQGGRAS